MARQRTFAPDGGSCPHFRGRFQGEDGFKEWSFRGFLHRVDGPATISPDGREEWCYFGARHRANGPAIRNADGSYERWFNYREITAYVDAWIAEGRLAPWGQWTEGDEIMFQMLVSGLGLSEPSGFPDEF